MLKFKVDLNQDGKFDDKDIKLAKQFEELNETLAGTQGKVGDVLDHFEKNSKDYEVHPMYGIPSEIKEPTTPTTPTEIIITHPTTLPDPPAVEKYGIPIDPVEPTLPTEPIEPDPDLPVPEYGIPIEPTGPVEPTETPAPSEPTGNNTSVEVNRIMDDFDKNGDGFISREERTKINESINEAGSYLDSAKETDENGNVTRKEIDLNNLTKKVTVYDEATGKTEIKEVPADEDVVEMMRSYDKDGDGKLSPSEQKSLERDLGDTKEFLAGQEDQNYIKVGDTARRPWWKLINYSLQKEQEPLIDNEKVEADKIKKPDEE